MKQLSGLFSEHTVSMLPNQTDKFSQQDLWLLSKIYWYEPNIYFNIINLVGFKVGEDDTIIEDCFLVSRSPSEEWDFIWT